MGIILHVGPIILVGARMLTHTYFTPMRAKSGGEHIALSIPYYTSYGIDCRSQWPRSLRRGSTAARLLGLRVRIPPRAWMSVCCECCVLSGRCLCGELITCPEESFRVWCAWVWSCSLEKWGGLGPQGAVEPLEKIGYSSPSVYNTVWHTIQQSLYLQ
jgi:hypothetical protein